MGRESTSAVAVWAATLRDAQTALWPARRIVSRLVLLVLAGAIVSTCRSPVGVLPPSGAIPFAAPAVYASWWAMVESCAGRKAPFDAVRWYIMPGAHSFSYGDMRVAGLWTRSGNTITVGEYARLNGQLVRHEMLHAVLRAGTHPRAQYLGSCAGVVTCGDNCVKDAGPPASPSPGTPHVDPSLLDVDFALLPDAPSGQRDDGWFTVTVRATNHHATPVMVELPLAADGTASRSFAFDISGALAAYRRSIRAGDEDAVLFAPGETKRYVFDLQLAGNGNPTGVQPGSYSLRAAFGDHWSAWRAVTVGP